jgi:hypothetical protein
VRCASNGNAASPDIGHTIWRHAQLLRAYRAETADYLQRVKGRGRASKD